MIRKDDWVDGVMADLLASTSTVNAMWSFNDAAEAIGIERNIANHRLLDADGSRYWECRAEEYRDGARYWWDQALISDWERGAMP